MEEEYYKNKTEGFSVVLEEGKKPESWFVSNADGIESQFEVNYLEKITEAVKATEELSKQDKTNIEEYINDNSDVVSEGIGRWLNESDLAGTVHSYLTEIFPNLPDLDYCANTLTEILLQIASLAS
ncbi:hypothetical protein V6255_01260 [Psychromonas arctica]|uniref:Uncharacterized protein n=1 Tax=Psychromonas arctica TaxID=168275 RepID=A0ABU9H7B0_9GAMM